MNARRFVSVALAAALTMTLVVTTGRSRSLSAQESGDTRNSDPGNIPEKEVPRVARTPSADVDPAPLGDPSPVLKGAPTPEWFLKTDSASRAAGEKANKKRQPGKNEPLVIGGESDPAQLPILAAPGQQKNAAEVHRDSPGGQCPRNR